MAFPDGKHVMLSYNWKNQKIVSKVCDILKSENIPVWFDIGGGMNDDIYKRYAFIKKAYTSHSIPFVTII